jgi:dihydrodipicolinate reductase
MGQSIAAVLADDLEAHLVAAMDREGCELIGRDMGALTGAAPSGVASRPTSKSS